MNGVVSGVDAVRFLFYLLCYCFQNNEPRVAKEVNMYLWVVITPFFVLRLIMILSYLSNLYTRQLPIISVFYLLNLLLQLTWLIYALVTLPVLLPTQLTLAFINYYSLIAIHVASIFLIGAITGYFVRREWIRAGIQVTVAREREDRVNKLPSYKAKDLQPDDCIICM